MSNEYNYSTTEHSVGTWIDGKTVYEKTIYRDSNFSYNTVWNLEEVPANFDKLIGATGYIRRANNNFDVLNWGKSDERLQIKVVQGYFAVYIASVFSPITELGITYQYTKTTD